LDYGLYRRLAGKGGDYRFTGGFESVTDGHTLWIRSDTLTIPVALANAKTYVLPMQEGSPESFDPSEEAPERIRWDRVSALAEGAKVFVGGSLVLQDERWTFVSTKETPLLVIFYDGSDRSLSIRAIRSGRDRNEYWNAVTPYALIAGALCLISIAASFLFRPAFRLTVITALVAVFIPFFPMLPPGVLFTVVYRRLWWRARIFRAYRDLARLPLRYLPAGKEFCILSGEERYLVIRRASLPDDVQKGRIPMLIPGEEKRKKDMWHIFGVLETPADGESQPEPVSASETPDEASCIRAPQDSFATFGVLPGPPETLARRYTFKAYTLEIISWLALLAGIGLNVFFIRMIFVLI
jgi:hypothetical protein